MTMKNFILTMCIVAFTTIFSSCSTDDPATVSTNKLQTQNDNTELRPILPVKGTVFTGTITGSYYPVIPAKAIAVRSKDLAYSGYIRETGLFKIAPVPVGTYTVMIMPKDSTLPAIKVENVEVRANQTTDVGALAFGIDH